MSQAKNPIKRGPVKTIPKCAETYNSSTIHSFIWRERLDSEKYDKGQLIVKFRDNPDRPEDPSKGPASAYSYNVPEKVFNKLAIRAESPDQYPNTVGEWFNKYLEEYVEYEDMKDGDLYVEKHNINR